MKPYTKFTAAAAVSLLMAGTAFAHSHKMDHSGHGSHAVKSVKIEKAWARATPGLAKNGAAYVTIMNHAAAADRLVAVKSSVAKRVEIHTHQMDNGIMRMRKLDAIDLQASKGVVFKPGGHHVMLIGLHNPLKKGTSFPLTLVFENAGEIETTVEVLGVGAMGVGSHGHGGHSGHK